MTQTIATLHYIMTFPHKSASFKFVTLIYKTEEKISGSKFIALMEELFTNTLSPLALFPVLGKLLVRGQIKRRCFLIMIIIIARGQKKVLSHNSP